MIHELGLILTIPDAFGTLEPNEKKDQIKASWSGEIGTSSFTLVVFAMPSAEFGFFEPEDVRDLIRDDFRKKTDKSFSYDKTELVNGPVGSAPFAGLGWGRIHDEGGEAVMGQVFVLGGLVEKYGYSIELVAEPQLDEANEKIVLEFLRKGVAYKGPLRNPQWTEAEVKARWAADAPEGLLKKLEKPLRTKHYIFLSNSDAAKQMGDEMEKSYAAIQKMYPFPEVTGRRLMPIFLFANETQYCAFYAKAFNTTVEVASHSKGVASRDFYATYYDAPQDPVHIHEMTHQIFGNRLRLGGAGSWFQEGVAQYICTKASDRTDAANLVRKDRHIKLAELISIDDLLSKGVGDIKKGNESGALYDQAALLIEFVRESKWSKDKFLEWVTAIGNCPDNNAVAIGRATKAVLGVDLAGLETKYIEYCKKR